VRHEEKLIYAGTRTNGLGHQTVLGYDRRFGAVNNETDPNTRTTTREYDALGRLTAETSPDGAITRVIRHECASAPVACPSSAVYLVATRMTHPAAPGKLGAPLSIAYYDALQREVRSETWSLNGAVVKADTEYYANGRLKRVSEPFTGFSANDWTVYAGYDALNRPLTVNGADGGSAQYQYLKC
jgi:YD repeat-containing protein